MERSKRLSRKELMGRLWFAAKWAALLILLNTGAAGLLVAATEGRYLNTFLFWVLSLVPGTALWCGIAWLHLKLIAIVVSGDDRRHYRHIQTIWDFRHVRIF